MREQSFKRGFTAQAKLAGLTNTQAEEIYKEAGVLDVLMKIPQFLNKIKGPGLSRILPATGGGLGAWGGYEASTPRTYMNPDGKMKTDPRSTINTITDMIGGGFGGALITDPRGWKNIVAKAKASNNPLRTFGLDATKELAIKGAYAGAAPAIQGGVGALTQANHMMQDVNDQLRPVFTKIPAAVDAAQNTASAVGRLADTASNVGKTVTTKIQSPGGLIGGLANPFVDENGKLNTTGKVGIGAGGVLGGGYLINKLFGNRDQKQKRRDY